VPKKKFKNITKSGNTSPLKNLPPLPKLGQIKPAVNRNTVRPLGPRLYKLAKNPDLVGGGPGEPPLGFVTGTTSRSEWRYYWALAKIFSDPLDPRRPPFTGGKEWQYQAAVDGRFTRDVGSSVIDFLIYQGVRKLGIRLQTERWHVMAGPQKFWKDFFLKTHSNEVDLIIDVFDQYSLADRTGEATIKQLKNALKGNQEPDPVRLGTALQVREPR
jgi:hypothetical protein